MQLVDHERELAFQELLRDLGWLPTDLECAEKKRLADEYLDATIAWRDAGRGLQITMRERLRSTGMVFQKGVLQKGEYDALAPTLEEARLKAARAKLELIADIAEHKC